MAEGPDPSSFSMNHAGGHEYKKLQRLRNTIIEYLASQKVSTQLANKLLGAGFITQSIYDRARNVASDVVERDRITVMFDAALAGVKLNSSKYQRFLSILKQIEGLEDIVVTIDRSDDGVAGSGDDGGVTDARSPTLSKQKRRMEDTHEKEVESSVDKAGEINSKRDVQLETLPVGTDSSQSKTQSHQNCRAKCLPASILVALLLFICSFVAFLVFLIHFRPTHVPAATKLGIQGDTIILSEFNSFDSTSLTITECLREGDDPQSLIVSLVRKRDIITYEINVTAIINKTTLPPAVRVNLLEEEYGIYLLRESFLAVNICLSSSWESTVTVLAFLFNNLDNYQNFLANKTDGIHSSLYYTPLWVGSSSQPICTWVNYSISAPA